MNNDYLKCTDTAILAKLNMLPPDNGMSDSNFDILLGKIARTLSHAGGSNTITSENFKI